MQASKWDRLQPVILILFASLSCFAKVDRVVVLKVDGLPEHVLEKYLNEPGGPGHEGRSKLPWIERVFQKNGVWMANYYSRGLSLSGPSWSILDTGQHAEIHGNSEYDRYTLRPYDYLNFFPFYLGYARHKRVDMPGVELLDEYSIPLLSDRFSHEEVSQGFQLMERGVNWSSLAGGLKHEFAGKPAKEVFDEWQIGFSYSKPIYAHFEQDLIRNLSDPKIRYLDFFTGEYDHNGHLTNDPVTEAAALEEIDAMVGRVWSAIARSPLAGTTVLALVSDHGMNTSPTIYSQGYSLVDWFNSLAGGAHHVLTNRHPLTEFKLRGLDPMVDSVITSSDESLYLPGDAQAFPTVMLDLDGNERASIALRNNTLNKLQVLLDQILHKKLSDQLRSVVIQAFLEVRDGVKAEWQKDLDELGEELNALDKRTDEEEAIAAKQPKKFTPEQHAKGEDKVARRFARRAELWRTEYLGYAQYRTVISRLLTVTREDFEAGRVRTDDVIPRKSFGMPNTMAGLENYVVGVGSGGLVLSPEGKLDLEKTFRTVNYLTSLTAIQVRNNPQAQVSSRPIDFIALKEGENVRVWASPERQAVVESRLGSGQGEDQGKLYLRYVPKGDFRPGLPLQLFEDPNLKIGGADRKQWLSNWHSEREWLEAVFATKYTNGIIDVIEAFHRDPVTGPSLLERYKARKERLREVDMIAFANDHWNFNVRGFNPGGNHGAFFAGSSHAVMLFAGGADSGVPRGVRVEAPYDSLSFTPSLLTLLGKPEPGLPGPVIQELLAH
jgi:hypothetical protein